MTKKLLVKFELDCGRQGSIESLFITTKKELKKLINQNMDFYEIVGKHSHVEHFSTEEDFLIMSEDQDKISNIASLLGTHISGVELDTHLA